jgi:hypothetical protein
VNPVALACGGWIASAVGAAATLDIAEHLGAGPRSARDLAGATHTDERVLKRMMRTLVVAGLFAREEDGRFANTPDSELLRDGHPQSMRRFCMLAAGDYQRVFQELLHSLRTGEPAARQALGGTLYEHLERMPEAAAVYDRAMEDLARPVGAALCEVIDFSEVRTVVDVGGGRGTVLMALLAAHPALRGICVDRPSVCARAQEELTRQAPSIAARLDYRPGDFFTEVPADGDIYLLKNVLHNWADAPSIRILTSIRAAMTARSAARLLVVEPLLDGPMPAIYKVLDDFMQVVICEPGATARTSADLRGLLLASDLDVVKEDTLNTGHSVLQAGIQSVRPSRD